MAGDARFWNRKAKKYAASPIRDEAAYEEKLRRTQAYFTPQSRVLEFGCGTGMTAVKHAPFVAHVDAIDYSGEMIAICRERAAEAGVTNVTFTEADILGYDAPDGAFDVIMGMSVLFLVRDRAAVLARVARLLKPGGVFVSSTFCMGDQMPYLRPFAPIGIALGLLPQVSFFTGDDLRAEITAAGFEIVEDWQPDPKAAIFLVARKQAGGAAE